MRRKLHRRPLLLRCNQREKVLLICGLEVGKGGIVRKGFFKIGIRVMLGVLFIGWAGMGHTALCVWKNPERDMHAFFPTAIKYQPRIARYTTAQKQSIERRLGTALDADETEIVLYQIVRKGLVPVGTVLCNQVRGKYGAIHTVVALDLDGRIVGVLVQKHREPADLNAAAFLKQFRGKSAGQPVAVGKDIHPITGATVSCAAVAASVKKSLVIFTVLRQSAHDEKKGRTR